MRRLLLFALLAGCAGPHLNHQALPELAAPAKVAQAQVIPLMLGTGERMIWDVSAHGMTIGRVELVVGAMDVRSSFNTTGIAAAFANAHHELATQLDRQAARATAMSETLVVDGETKQSEGALDAGQHTMHSALGWVRAWAKPGAQGAFLLVRHLTTVYRLDVAPPVVEDLNGVKTLRVDCEVRAPDKSDPVPFAIWLSADERRIPMKLVFDTKGGHITADLI